MFSAQLTLQGLTSLVVLMVATTANAQVATLVQDAFVAGTNPDDTFGTKTTIRVATFGPREALIQFDLSGVSGGIASATLTLPVAAVVNPGSMSIWTVSQSWHQNSVTYSSNPASASSGLPAVTVSDAPTALEIDVTSIVQGWVDNPSSNHGLAFKPESGAFHFGSLEGGIPASLEIETGSPPPSAGWPAVSCPCDAYYSRGVDVYLSLGGVIHKKPSVGDEFSACEADVQGTPEWDVIEVYAERRDDGDASVPRLGLYSHVERSTSGLQGHCTANVRITDQAQYIRSKGNLTYEEFKACAESVLDYCADWDIGTGNPLP